MQKVSVIMPAYNSQKTICESVQSVLSQTYTNWELVIISDDEFDYKNFLEKNYISDDRIKIFYSSGTAKGAAEARNIGLKLATSNIIALLDSDDLFHDNKLEIFLPKVLEHGLASSAMEICDENNNKIKTVGIQCSQGLYETHDLFKLNYTGHSQIIFRYNEKLFYDSKITALEDLEFTIQLSQYFDSFYFFSPALHKYRKTLNSISNSENTNQIYKSAKKELISRLQNNFYSFKSSEVKNNFIEFFESSLLAEDLFLERKKSDNKLLFEDVIEKIYVSKLRI